MHPLVSEPIPIPQSREWLRARTELFELVSDAGPRRTREVADELQVFASTLQRLHPRFRRHAGTTLVFVFGRRSESQPFFDELMHQKDAKTAGVFVISETPGARGTMIVDSGADWLAERTPMHELVHDLLSGAGTRPPLWLEEGMAEYFSARGVPIRVHLQLLARLGHQPLDELFAARRGSPESLDPRFYATAWAAAAALIPEAGFDALLDDVEHGVPIADALQSRYRWSLVDLERAIVNPKRKALAFLVDRRNTARIDVEPMARWEAIAEIGELLASLPGSQEDGFRFRDAALSERPDDAGKHLLLAESLLGDAAGPLAESTENLDPAKLREARAEAERALALGADPSRAWPVIATSWIVEPDVPRAIEALRKAHSLAPSRTDVALHLAALLYRSNAIAEADALMAELERSPDPRVVQAAHHVYLRERIPQANALVDEKKFDEAAAIFRAAAAKTSGPNMRQQLEDRASRLEATAESNREIAAYNEAVRQANRGETAAALATLDRLLASAKDASVIEDARRLRGKLGGR